MSCAVRHRLGFGSRPDRRTAGPVLGGWIVASQLELHWNFYLFAIPGVVGIARAGARRWRCGPYRGAQLVIDVEVGL